MRDPQRIAPMVQALGELWREHPDWRLGQLVVNAAGVDDPFYVEDDRMADGLARLAVVLRAQDTKPEEGTE